MLQAPADSHGGVLGGIPAGPVWPLGPEALLLQTASPNRILRREFPISRPVYVIKPQTGFSIPQGSPSPVVRRSVFRR